MRKKVIAALLIASALMTGCSPSEDKPDRTTVKTITLYGNSGEAIQTWTGKISKVYVGHSTISFVLEDGKKVRISGTIVVEEK